MSSSSGILGNTIEEKTRTILGWTDGFATPAPTQTCTPLLTAAFGSCTNANVKVNAESARRAERVCKKQRSVSTTCSPSSYPYSLLGHGGGEQFRRKSSAASVMVSANDGHAVSELQLLRHQLTPPPSPILNQNGVTVVLLPRSNCQQQQDVQQPKQQQQHQMHHMPISPVSPTMPNMQSSHSFPNGPQQLQQSAAPLRGAGATEIFERLRTQVPHLAKEQSKFRVLVQTVANVIELETKLAQLQEETRSLSCILQQKTMHHQQPPQTYSAGAAADFVNPERAWENKTTDLDAFSYNATFSSPGLADVPDDLQEIDVTAFRSLVSSNHKRRASIDEYSTASTCESASPSSATAWSPYYYNNACGGENGYETSSISSSSVFNMAENDFESVPHFEDCNSSMSFIGCLTDSLAVDTLS